MPAIDLADDTYVACDPDQVAARVHEPDRWADWWPGLRLTVTRDRGPKGLQWVARSSVPPGRTWRGRPVRWVGSLEIWLEPVGQGTVVHHYQRLDPETGGLPARTADRLRAARARAWKRSVHALKDELEAVGVKPGRCDADNQGR